MMVASTAPKCPECGCLEHREESQKAYFGRFISYRRCAKCLHVFPIELPPADEETASIDIPLPVDHERGPMLRVVRYAKADDIRCMCPKCGAKNPPVTKTQRRNGRSEKVRYHRCACGEVFKSFAK